jgi:hypothetical protein
VQTVRQAAESRAPWAPEVGPEWTRYPIAGLRFGAATSTWVLYWRDRNLVWHRYRSARRSTSVARDGPRSALPTPGCGRSWRSVGLLQPDLDAGGWSCQAPTSNVLTGVWSVPAVQLLAAA